MNQDLRELLLRLYMQNNPQFDHKVFIYTYQGVSDAAVNPFRFVGADLPPNVRKSLILQNLPSGEMLQAFIVEQEEAFGIENTVLYGNKGGVLVHIGLDKGKIERSDKYQQFAALADSMLRQFQG
ncbi:MAG: hypothetical protein Q3966_02135 [Neisseria sp.]|nr:hypothetical protein [Neisseria sp.]